MLVPDPLIGAEQADFCRDGLANEFREGSSADVLDDACHHVTLAADCASDSGLAGTDASSSTAAALVPMPVLGLAADERLVNFNDPHELLKILLGQPGTNAMTHIPSRLIGAEAHH